MSTCDREGNQRKDDLTLRLKSIAVGIFRTSFCYVMYMTNIFLPSGKTRWICCRSKPKIFAAHRRGFSKPHSSCSICRRVRRGLRGWSRWCDIGICAIKADGDAPVLTHQLHDLPPFFNILHQGRFRLLKFFDALVAFRNFRLQLRDRMRGFFNQRHQIVKRGRRTILFSF